ncbi:MAG: ABC transporter substrate-binding protein [Planctomycetaceae bacterium]|jgi:iron complex transport system substrate-binding protein|nr:ABC transporter substrate-binding protein [Planctomycetaceae bacterium]
MYRIIFSLLILFLGCVPPAEPPSGVSGSSALPPQRIISTLPSITEVLFDIGLGDRIVGDSDFTKYPPEAVNIDKIGGLYDINRERIVSLKPDLMILSTENAALRQSVSAPVLIVDHRTLNGVLDSYLVIGEVFGGDILTTAQKKRQDLIEKLDSFTQRIKGKKTCRVLISIDRSYGTGRIQNLYVAGADSFLSEAVTRAGGENAAASLGLLAPQLSAEGVIRLAPDVIIDVQISGRDITHSESDWYHLGNSVPAVKNRRILTLTDDFATIPGPRTPLLIEKIIQYFESQREN